MPTPMIPRATPILPIKPVIRNSCHRPQLDALRAFAILGVLYTHLDQLDSPFGFLGVRLFFVISGFLITSILLRSREAIDQGGVTFASSLKTFYIRRGIRIYPAYYTVLFLAAVKNFQQIRSVLPYHLFFVSNFLFAARNEYVPLATAPLWSISIEEQFYLLWPFLVLLAPRPLLRPAIIATMLLGIGFRFASLLLPISDFAQWFLPPAALDTLAAGALLALPTSKTSWPRWLAPSAIFASLLYITRYLVAGMWAGPHSPIVSRLVDTLAVLPMAALTAYAFTGFRGLAGRVLKWGPLLYIGRISFGIYLWHSYVVFALFQRAARLNPRLGGRGTTLLVVGSALSIALASVSWFVIERPFNRLKRLFPYTRLKLGPPS